MTDIRESAPPPAAKPTSNDEEWELVDGTPVVTGSSSGTQETEKEKEKQNQKQKRTSEVGPHGTLDSLTPQTDGDESDGPPYPPRRTEADWDLTGDFQLSTVEYQTQRSAWRRWGMKGVKGVARLAKSTNAALGKVTKALGPRQQDGSALPAQETNATTTSSSVASPGTKNLQRRVRFGEPDGDWSHVDGSEALVSSDSTSQVDQREQLATKASKTQSDRS